MGFFGGLGTPPCESHGLGTPLCVLARDLGPCCVGGRGAPYFLTDIESPPNTLAMGWGLPGDPTHIDQGSRDPHPSWWLRTGGDGLGPPHVLTVGWVPQHRGLSKAGTSQHILQDQRDVPSAISITIMAGAAGSRQPPPVFQPPTGTSPTG